MENITAGQVAHLKTTGEPCFVLAIVDNVASVRRPVDTEHGVVHQVEEFTVAELETLADVQNRKIQEMQELKARFANSDNAEVANTRQFSN